MRKRATSDETLEQKIVKAQEKVVRTAAAHEKAVDELQILLDKRDAKRKEEVWEAIVNSPRSYEDILKMIRNELTDED
ncbi:MAG: hypothetical protein IKF90_17260 [Parasporobacterium sp.]|jgi:hypothetical protein|nr:hypothetical protein [Parasporobacterium sp.]